VTHLTMWKLKMALYKQDWWDVEDNILYFTDTDIIAQAISLHNPLYTTEIHICPYTLNKSIHIVDKGCYFKDEYIVVYRIEGQTNVLSIYEVIKHDKELLREIMPLTMIYGEETLQENLFELSGISKERYMEAYMKVSDLPDTLFFDKCFVREQINLHYKRTDF
jgi:hypothetical protein